MSKLDSEIDPAYNDMMVDLYWEHGLLPKKEILRLKILNVLKTLKSYLR